MRIHLLAVCAASLLATPAAACLFDSDCPPGSQCVKLSGSVRGACTGSTQGGDDPDRNPVYDPLDPKRKLGKPCRRDSNCGPGHRCDIPSGEIRGVCVRPPQP